MQLPDDPNKSDEKINVLSEEQVVFWCRQLGVTEQDLRKAVFIEGPCVQKVIEFLKRKGLLPKK